MYLSFLQVCSKNDIGSLGRFVLDLARQLWRRRWLLCLLLLLLLLLQIANAFVRSSEASIYSRVMLILEDISVQVTLLLTF